MMRWKYKSDAASATRQSHCKARLAMVAAVIPARRESEGFLGLEFTLSLSSPHYLRPASHHVMSSWGIPFFIQKYDEEMKSDVEERRFFFKNLDLSPNLADGVANPDSGTSIGPLPESKDCIPIDPRGDPWYRMLVALVGH